MILVVSIMVVGCEKETLNDDRPGKEVMADEYNQFAKTISDALKNKEFRNSLYQAAMEKRDGDYDVVVKMVKDIHYSDKPFASYITDVATMDVDAFLTKNPLANIYIHNIEKWDWEHEVPLVATRPVDDVIESADEVVGIEPTGELVWVDAVNAPDYPVVVIGDNERFFYSAELNRYSRDPYFKDIDYARDMPPPSNPDGQGSTGGSTSGSCSSSSATGGYNFGFTLCKIRCINLGSYEYWTAGAPELRTNYLGGSPYASQGINIATRFNEPVKRKDINNKDWYVYEYITTWSQSYGDKIWHSWYEEDNGVWDSDQQDWSLELDGFSANVPIPRFFRSNRHHLGDYDINRNLTFSQNFGGSQIAGTITRN